MVIPFLILSLFTIISAILVIFFRKPIYSLISLIFTFIFASFSLFLLNIKFIPFIILIIYVGVILILFLFITLSLDIKNPKISLSTYIFNLFIFLGLIFILSYSIIYNIIIPNMSNNFFNSFFFFDKFLQNDILIYTHFFYTSYFIYFLICGLGLLVVLIGSVVIALHIKNIKVLKNKRKHV